MISFFMHRAPMRGWIGILLLLVASVAFILIDLKEDSRLTPHWFMFITFLLVSPIAVVYSFRARRRAPDPLVALGAFSGSFVVAAFWLFLVVGIVGSFFVS